MHINSASLPTKFAYVGIFFSVKRLPPIAWSLRLGTINDQRKVSCGRHQKRWECFCNSIPKYGQHTLHLYVYMYLIVQFALTSIKKILSPEFKSSKAPSIAPLNCSASSLLWKLRPYTCLWSLHWWNVGVAALYFMFRMIEQLITT